nr:unnamed protein product [Haemonchus contortus]
MSVSDIEIEDFSESFGNWRLVSDDDAAGGLDGDVMAPAVVSDTEISDGDCDEGEGRLAVQELQRHSDKQFGNTQAEAGG